MKTFIAVLMASLAFTLSRAQVAEGKLEIEKAEHPAVVGSYGYAPELVLSVIRADLKDKGFGKGDEKKDVYKYEGIEFTSLSKEKIDLYIKVEQTDKKEMNRSTVYLLIKKADNNFVSSTTDLAVYNAAVSYMNLLALKYEVKKLETSISSQEDAIKEAEKKLDEIRSVKKDLEKQKEKIEDQIKEYDKKK